MLTRITNNSQTPVTSVKRITSNSVLDAQQAQYWNGAEWITVWPTGPVLDDFYAISDEGLLTITPAFRTALDNNQSYMGWEPRTPLPNPNVSKNITSMYATFENFNADTIDLSEWDFSTVTNFARMFNNCRKLLNLNFINKTFSEENINVSEMISNCFVLKSFTFENCSIMKINNMLDIAGTNVISLSKVEIPNFDLTYISLQEDPSLLIGNAFRINVQNIAIQTRSTLESGLLNDYGQRTNDCYYTHLMELIPFYKRVDSFTTDGSISLVEEFREALVNEADYYTEEGLQWTFGSPIPNPNTDSTLKTMSSLFYTRRTVPTQSTMPTLNLTDFTFTNVKNLSSMFYTAHTVTLILPDVMDFSMVETISSMFYANNTITSFDFSNTNLNNVSSMSSAFYGCPNLTSVNFSNLNLENITSMSNTFYGCTKLTTVDFANSTFLNLTSLYRAFYNTDLLTFNLSNTPKLTNLEEAFYNNTSIQQVQLSIGTLEEKVDNLNMKFAFRNCSALESFSFENIKATKLDLESTFYGCTSMLTCTFPLDYEYSISTMLSTFYGCTSLQTLDFTKGILTSDSNAEYYRAFYNCNALTGGWTSSFGDADKLNLRSNTSLKTGSYFYFNDPITAFYNVANKTVELNGNFKQAILTNTDYVDEDSVILWTAGDALPNIPTEGTSVEELFINMQSVVSLDLSLWDTSRLLNISNLFMNCTALTEVIWKDTLDLQNVLNASNIFRGCTSLISTNFLQIAEFRDLEFMSGLFYGCTKLTTITLDKDLNTPNLKNLSSLCFNCTSLTNVDFIKRFNLSSITDISLILNGCTSLAGEIDWSTLVFNQNDYIYAYNAFNNIKVTKISLNAMKIKLFNSITSSYSKLFGILNELVELNISNLKFEPVVNNNYSTYRYLFGRFSKLTTINSSNIDLTGTLEATYLFGYNTVLTSIDLSTFETPNITSLASWFINCRALTVDTLMNAPETASVNSLSNTFSGCTGLTNISFLKNWNLSLLESLHSTFSGCTSLTTIDIENINFNLLKSLNQTFLNCSKLVTITNNTNINLTLANLTDLNNTFKGCRLLTTNNFLEMVNIPNVINMQGLYANCVSLTETTLNPTTPYNALTNISEMYTGCTSLTNNIIIKNLSTQGINAKNVIVSNASPSILVEGITFSNTPASAQLGNSTVNYTLNITNCTFTGSSMTSMCSAASKLTAITFDNVNTTNVTSLTSTFSSCTSLTSISLVDLDLSNVTSLTSTFSSCTSLTEIFLDNINFAKLTTIYRTFLNARNLVTCSLTNTTFPNVTSASEMFQGCSALTSIDFSSTQFNKVENVYNMFYNCTLLETCNFGINGLSAVTNMSGMFQSCKLVLPDIASWDLSKVKTMTNTFSDAYNVISNLQLFENLNLTSLISAVNCFAHSSTEFITTDTLRLPLSFKTAPIVSLNSIFSRSSHDDNISTITTIDLSNINMETIQSISSICTNQKEVTNIIFPTEGTSPNLTDISSAFLGCSALTSINLGNLTTENITTLANTFNGCTLLGDIVLENFFIENTFNILTNLEGTFSGTAITTTNIFPTNLFNKVINISKIFENCTNLINANLNAFDINLLTNMSYAFKNTAITSITFMKDKTFLAVTDIQRMFNLCTNLTSTADFTNITFPVCKNILSIFGECSNLKHCVLDNLNFPALEAFNPLNGSNNTSTPDSSTLLIQNINAPNVYSLAGLGAYTESLNIIIFKNCTFKTITNTGSLAYGSNALTGIDFGNLTFRFSSSSGYYNAFGAFVNSIFVNDEASLTQLIKSASAKTKTFIKDSTNILYDVRSSGDVIFNTQFLYAILTHTDYVDSEGTTLWTFDTPLPNIPAETTTIYRMFWKYSTLPNVDLTLWDTTNINTIRSITYNEKDVYSFIDVSTWNTSNVTELKAPFEHYINTIDLSGWDVTNVTSWDNELFNDCVGTCYAKDQENANLLNAHTTLNFVVKPIP